VALNLPASITISANVQGSQNLNTLARQLQQLSASSQLSGRSLDRLYTETRKLGGAAGNTISSLKGQATALRALRDEAEFGSRKFKLLTRDIEAVESRLKRYQQTAGQAGGLTRGGALMAGLAGGIAGGVATMVASKAADAVGGIAQAGLSAETAQVRLKALTEQFGEYNQAQASAERIAKTLRISQTEATDGFSQLYAALRPTGVTLKETEDAFIGFTAAARASGATSTEASAALLQLKQALGSGVLQGDELRSIREQAPLVGQAIAKEMGVTIGELKKLGSEGKITTDIVLKALATLKDENLGKLNQQFDTGAQAIKDFQVAAENLGKVLSRIFGPTIVAAIKDVTSGIRDMADVLGSLSGDKDAEARLRNRITARDMAADETGKRFGISGLWRQGEQQSFFQQRQQQIFDRLEEERLVRREQAAAKEAATRDQQRAKDDAAQERQAGRQRALDQASEDERKKREKMALDLANNAAKLEQDLSDLREDRERRLAEFREQSIQKAADLERSLGDQRQELERNTAELRRRIAGQEADFQLEAERLRLRANGLSTDGIELQQRLNEATRRFSEARIQAEEQASNKRVQLERTLEDYKLAVTRGIAEILKDAAQKMADKMREGARDAASIMNGGAAGAAAAAGSGRTGPGGIIARTGNSGDSTGPHLDARWADRRPITMADVARYVRLNGQVPGSGAFPATSGYGPRSLFGRSFHYGQDIGSGVGTAISLVNGATLSRNLGNTGAGGYAVEISTPEGAMRLLHLLAGSAAVPGAGRPAAAASPASSAVAPGDIPGMAKVTAAGSALDRALGANTAAGIAAAGGDLIASRQAELGGITAELDQQAKSASQQLDNYKEILQLQRSGLTPELAQQRFEAITAANAETDKLQVLRDQLVIDQAEKGLTDQQRANLQGMVATIDERLAKQKGIVAGLTAEQQQLEQLRQAYERQKQLVEGIANSIGNGISQGIDLLIEGTDNWGDSLRQIAAGVLKDIARQIAQTMVVQPIVAGLKSGLSSLFGFADGGVMTSAGPLPLRTYAGGGIASSPQLAMFGEGSMPEAYVPLPDGRRIPVAMKGGGGGGTTVNVSVDASGTQVQGNAGQGEQLGRVVAQAVQAELIRQKRPGGLLAA
jgi:hypothetical protein